MDPHKLRPKLSNILIYRQIGVFKNVGVTFCQIGKASSNTGKLAFGDVIQKANIEHGPVANPIFKIAIAFHQPEIGLIHFSGWIISEVKLKIHAPQRTVIQAIEPNRAASLQIESKKMHPSLSAICNFEPRPKHRISSKIQEYSLKITINWWVELQLGLRITYINRTSSCNSRSPTTLTF